MSIDKLLNTVSIEKTMEISIDSGVLDKVRLNLIQNYKEQINKLFGKENNKAELLNYIRSTLSKLSLNIDENIIYDEIFSLSFINKYIERDDFEEMNANSWDDIEVVYSDRVEKIKDKFISKEQAINIAKKMALIGGATLDEAYPTQDSFIGTGLRFTCSISPIVDKDVGVAFSLRKVSRSRVLLKDLIDSNSYSQDEVDFLLTCASNRVSILFGGATGSGKTTDMQLFLNEIAKRGKDRIFTIEESTRELHLIHKDKDNNYISKTIHNKTRPSENLDTLNVDSDYLVKNALRYDPDIICPAEIRGKEALSSVEASLTDHTILSSAHISSVTKAYRRLLIASLKSEYAYNQEMMLEDIVSAFPIVVFKKHLKKENNKRYCMKIFEATGVDKETKKIKGRMLFRFFKTYDANNNLIGEHKMVNSISNRLSQLLYENGCAMEEIKKYNPNFKINEDEDYTEDYIED